uniref:Carbamoyl phosphate synthase small chain n=1 Tax=Cliftonaea pectinata TaxID=2007206 RepID=A0A1Z1MPK3_9FLOR|nr:carbamoyl phosphate synthase small subunit [Cliftonaea pectinata]ARW68013.1 carbamoyl phosphate synthase small subunit [Cliftonaea pectinata]
MLNFSYTTILYLQDGTSYRGWSYCRFIKSSGEIVFNTGMTGYQEVVTDPSYAGQIVIFTYPEIGNTGLNFEDNESNLFHPKGIVMKNISSCASNWRSDISFKEYIVYKNIPHIFGIDTRSLTKHLRSSGVMSGIIINIDHVNLVNNSLFNRNLIDLDNLDLIQRVTTKKNYTIYSKDFVNKSLSTSLIIKTEKYKKSCFTILVIDFGVKFNILRRLLLLGCNIVVLPASCNYNEIIKYQPDGLLLSNGPGNPLVNNYFIQTIKKVVNFSNIPIFGICMGHQILSLALGAQTFKLKFGHRGLNHPSGFLSYSEITTQNHGFAVSSNSLCKNDILKINNFNLNDLTVSGILHNYKPVFSVQYHPEASPGPHDSDYLFKLFIDLIKLVKLRT